MCTAKRVAYMDQETLLGLLFEMYDQKGDYYRSIETTYVLVEPMGIYNGRDLNLNWIDTHSTLVYLPAYPALWLSREEMNIKNRIRAK